MTNPSAQKRWFEAWANQLDAAQTGADLRPLHRWLWSEWKRDGPAVATGTNAALDLLGDDRMQPDFPHLFAGRPDDTDVLFVNINPGWNSDLNRYEDKIVGRSEDAAWSFCRALFTRYPAEVGRMWWWSQAIGIAWRIVHGKAPHRMTAHEKGQWANSRVSGWELLPLHSKSAGILKRMVTHPLGTPVRAAMRASLGFAIRCSAPVTVVASSIGTSIAAEFAHKDGWKELRSADIGLLGNGARAFQMHNRLILALPRQLVSKYSGTKFDELAGAVRRLHSKAHA